MADGDDATDVDVDESSFLTGVTSIEGVSWSGASGVDVGRLARAIVGTAVFTVAAGVNTVVSGLTAAVTGLIDGVSEFLAGATEWFRIPGVGWRPTREAGLIEVIFGTGIAAIRGAWSFNVDTFGPLSLPVGLAVVLGTFLVVARGIEQIQEVI
ncbi:hypothetical protein EXE48_17910 [Halorubrum sp. ASP1]|uniref:Uncharacterized protein n=2 Tax=Halorubrum distributum TaxID=29283 RepID=M0ESP7_9EURY|nr:MULTISPECIES: hypothetical protein [Halorubrum]ELZ50720.1 hypothetical protein C465_05241 [Halorubrum distributum JCM 9100]ELZ52856.1 hypothetical protein C466_09872 [Halorubrum distributum JCM 10118]TKX57573.1 hypothetical protein EXE48_17910 [Halorubrum sp. ASP1]